MGSTTINTSNGVPLSGILLLGQNGFTVECGTGQFNGTDLSDTQKTNLSQVLGVILVPGGNGVAPATGEVIYWADTATAGVFKPTGTITISRTAAVYDNAGVIDPQTPTSGLGYTFWIFGY